MPGRPRIMQITRDVELVGVKEENPVVEYKEKENMRAPLNSQLSS